MLLFLEKSEVLLCATKQTRCIDRSLALRFASKGTAYNCRLTIYFSWNRCFPFSTFIDYACARELLIVSFRVAFYSRSFAAGTARRATAAASRQISQNDLCYGLPEHHIFHFVFRLNVNHRHFSHTPSRSIHAHVYYLLHVDRTSFLHIKRRMWNVSLGCFFCCNNFARYNVSRIWFCTLFPSVLIFPRFAAVPTVENHKNWHRIDVQNKSKIQISEYNSLKLSCPVWSDDLRCCGWC